MNKLATTSHARRWSCAIAGTSHSRAIGVPTIVEPAPPTPASGFFRKGRPPRRFRALLGMRSAPGGIESDSDVQGDFERHFGHLNLAAAARALGDFHQAMALQNANVFLNVFEIAVHHPGQR